MRSNGHTIPYHVANVENRKIIPANHVIKLKESHKENIKTTYQIIRIKHCHALDKVETFFKALAIHRAI